MMKCYTPHMTLKATILLSDINEGVISTMVESECMFNFNFNFNIDPLKIDQILTIMLNLKLKLKLNRNYDIMNVVNYPCYRSDSDLVKVVDYKHDR